MTMGGDTRALIKGIWLFARLGEAEIDRIVGLARPRHVAVRTTVIAQGDPSDHLFIVLQGRLKTTVSNEAGDEVLLSILGPGEAFGEIALLDGEPRSATVSTLEACDLLVIAREPFRALLVDVPALALDVMAMLAKRVRVLTEHAQDLSLLGIPKRLAKVLLALGDRFGERSPSGTIKLTFKLSQQDLANMVGATREMVNRSLREWVRRGLLVMDDGQLELRQPDALRAEAAEASETP
jgi:CRP/FNR family transcriptional regulator, cyclic AMP receptor protein